MFSENPLFNREDLKTKVDSLPQQCFGSLRMRAGSHGRHLNVQNASGLARTPPQCPSAIEISDSMGGGATHRILILPKVSGTPPQRPECERARTNATPTPTPLKSFYTISQKHQNASRLARTLPQCPKRERARPNATLIPFKRMI